MCQICDMARCPVNCPNYREKGVYSCKICGGSIAESEQMYRISGNYYHKDCLLDFYDKDELLALLGYLPRLASKEVIKEFSLILGGKDGK